MVPASTGSLDTFSDSDKLIQGEYSKNQAGTSYVNQKWKFPSKGSVDLLLACLSAVLGPLAWLT